MTTIHAKARAERGQIERLIEANGAKGAIAGDTHAENPVQLSLKFHLILRKQTIDNPLSQPLACASEHHVIDIEQQDEDLRILVQDVDR